MTQATQNQGAANPADGTQQPNTQGNQGASQNQNQPAGNQQAGGGEEQKTVPISAMHEERTKRQELQTTLEKTQAQLAQMQQQMAFGQMQNQPQQGQFQPGYGYQQQQQQFQQPDPMAQINELWEKDPRKAADTQIMMAMQYRDQVDAQVELQLNEIGGKFKDFAQYEGQVRNMLRTVPFDKRGMPGMAETAYLVVKGQKAPEMVAQASQQATQQMQAGQMAAGVGTGMVSGTPQSAGALTQEELTIAAKMGMTPEDYSKYKR